MPYRKSKLWGQVAPHEGATIDWGDPINNSLLGCWPLSEGAGVVAKDIARINAATLVSGTPWFPSLGAGSVPKFNGSTQWADAGDQPPFRITGAMTLALWCLGTPAAAAGGCGKCGANGNRGFALGPQSTNVATFFVASNSTTLVSVSSGAIHTATRPWFYAGVYIPSVSLTVYQNGVQVAQNTTSIPASQFTANSIPLRMGDRGDGTAAFNGRVWGCRIYSRALIQSELYRLFEEPLAGIVAPRRRIISSTPAGGARLSTLTLLGTG